MAIQGGTYRCDLAFCKLGDTAWTDLSGPLRRYSVIKYSIKDKVFYAMGGAGRIETWDFRDLSSIKRIPIDDDFNSCAPRFRGLEAALRNNCYKKYHPVDSSGDLLLVQRHYNDGTVLFNKECCANTEYPYQTYRFDVYKLDSSLRWNYVKCLGDYALFLGFGDTFSVYAYDFSGLRPNSIYFADCARAYDSEGFILGSHDLCIFDLEHNRIEPFHPFGCLKKNQPPPLWVAPNLHAN